MIRKYPFYFKTTVILFGLALMAFILFSLRDIMIPLAISLLLATLLNPIVSWFQKKKIPQTLAITFAMLIALIVITIIGYFICSQLAGFSDEMPVLKKRLVELFAKAQQAIQHSTGITMKKQEEFINSAKTDLKPFIGSTIGTVLGSVAVFVLLPVYTFLFLYYKKLILNFLFDVFDDKNSKEVGVVLQQTKGAIQSYMAGLLLEGLIVATLNSIALLLLGVKYAILLGVIGAILNVLPYIGGIIAISLPVIIATITTTGFGTQLGVILAYILIQFIDNHFLIPVIVSSRVRINALISIIVVLLGGALWGISGMFLAIPFIAVLKIIFDRIPELKSWGKLLGDDIPTTKKKKMRA